MGELKRLALNYREWLEKCQQALQRGDCPADALPVFLAEQFLDELSLAAMSDKKAGADPEPLLAGMASIARRHNRRVAREIEANSGPQATVTVNRMNLLRQSYLGRLEAGLLELLCKARIAANLSRLRDHQGISLRQLEQQSGVSFSYLSQIERLSGSLPSSEILASLDAAMSPPEGAPGATLLRQRGLYDTGLQTLQQEEALFGGAWNQIMGGGSYQANPIKRNPAGHDQMVQPGHDQMVQPGRAGAGRTSPGGGPGRDERPGVRRPVAPDTAGDGGHEGAGGDGNDYYVDGIDDVDGIDGVDDVVGDAAGDDNSSAGILSAAPGREAEVSTFELCDYFVNLNPGMQRAVLRLVKDLAGINKNRRRGF